LTSPQDKTQSAWPEYAVKIIQASKIAELGYKSSVIREMAVLQLLSHPGVSRLVSAFRYSDSAYMVLEYAARGDLHTYLTKHGKLAHKYCR
jgi:serine/threonine protein kinase